MLKICLILLESNMIFARIIDFNFESLFGGIMHFLLVNKNAAVKKIFNITAKKAGIDLDIVDSIDKIPLDKDYSCIFVDDDMLKTGDIGDFKTKMITTKFCVILAKDSPLVGGFDSYIRKPFLPTDIYEALKKEKYNDMSGTYDEGDSDDLGDNGLDDNTDGDINANSDIDLSEFSDSEDEFLSGVKEPETSQDIDFSGNPMGDSNISDSGDSDATSAIDSNSVNGDKSSAGDFEIPTTFDLDSVDLGYLGDSASGTNLSGNLSTSVADSNVGAQNVDLNLDVNSTVDSTDLSTQTPIQDITQDVTQNTAPLDLDSVDFGTDLGVSSATQPKGQLQDTGNLDLHNVDSADLSNGDTNLTIQTDLQSTPVQQSEQQTDNIDFSQIMALQDEILEEEKAKSKKKSIIGGDIYTPKGEVHGATQTSAPNLAQTPQDIAPQQMPDIANIAPDITDLEQGVATNDIDLTKQTESIADATHQDSPIDLVQPQTDLPSNDFIDLAQDSHISNADSNTDSIDVAQDTTLQNFGELQEDLEANPTMDSAQSTQDFSIDLAQDINAQSPNVADITLQNADLQSDSPNIDLQEPMKDAQGAEDDFLESLDFLKDPVTSTADSDIIDMSGIGTDSTPSPSTFSPDLTQDSLDSMPPPAPPPPDLTQSQNVEPPKYEEYSFDSMANEEFDGLDGLSGISSIASDVLPPSSPKPITKDANDILNNLEISPQDNIDTDYHADSVSVGSPQTIPLNQSEDALNHVDEHNFNSAFSSGISAEMDSISPNFKAQDFIQDLTLGSDTTLPDFSKSLKQHTTAEQRYNMLGLPINEDGAVKDIQDLSKNELESLDDEAILLLQENSLQNKSTLKPSQKDAANVTPTTSHPSQDSLRPKILDKQQIDDITNILEGTQKSNVGAPEGMQKSQKPSVSINNNEFGSLTQEALSEVLGEEILDDEFESGDNFMDTTSNMTNNSLKKSPTSKATNSNINQSQIPPIPSQINLGDSSINVAELLQTFPIDKIRELLSGVQITVNITFPTKKQ